MEVLATTNGRRSICELWTSTCDDDAKLLCQANMSGGSAAGASWLLR